MNQLFDWSIQQYSNQYERALRRAIWNKWVSWFTRRDYHLMDYESIRPCITLITRHDLGIQTVLVCHIVGTVGRATDFDHDFMPLRETTKERWIRIARATFEGQFLPPVELYKVDNVYFVEDGNHRVSVAKLQGQAFIEAHVIEIEISNEVSLTVEDGLIC